MLGEIQLRVR